MFWNTRIRSLLSICLTILLIAFVLTWTLDPGQLQVTAPPATTTTATPGANNTTATTTNTRGNATVISPFVGHFFIIYGVVISFYFGSVTAEAIAKQHAPTTSSDGADKKKRAKVGAIANRRAHLRAEAWAVGQHPMLKRSRESTRRAKEWRPA